MQGLPAIVVHGGAGRRAPDPRPDRQPGLLAAVRAGWSLLSAGALEAVVAAVSCLEDDPLFNAGFGSVLTQEGTVEMDASVMEGARLAAGAVAAVSGVRNPVRLAAAILERGPHLFLAGEAARRHAVEWGIAVCEPAALIAPAQLERWRAAEAAVGGNTVGAVAIDARGHVAAATSTGGTFRKWSGRIGDSAVIGAGTYADDRTGAASATGNGEAILRLSLARQATARLAAGVDPRDAAQQAIAELAQRTAADAGLILVDAFGRLGWATNAESMEIAWQCGAEEARVASLEL